MQTVLAASVADSLAAAAACLSRYYSCSDSFAALPASECCVQYCTCPACNEYLLSGRMCKTMHHRLDPDAAVLKDAWEPFAAPSSNFFWTLSTWSTRSAASSFASLRPISLTAVVMTCSTSSGSLQVQIGKLAACTRRLPQILCKFLRIVAYHTRLN